MTGDRFVDSAGQPWAGRHFEPTPFADDDGSAPPALVASIERFNTGEVGQDEIVEALRGTRLLVPMLATLGEAAEGPHGVLVDKSADLAIVTVAGRDGRRVLPVFTSVEAMGRWNPKARPVPVEAERVAVAAAAEDTELVVVDPASDTEHGLRRSALEALATGRRFVPCWRRPELADAFAASLDEAAVQGLSLLPADPRARLDGPELLVRLELTLGLTRDAVEALLTRLTARWSADPVIAAIVDGLIVKLAAASAD